MRHRPAGATAWHWCCPLDQATLELVDQFVRSNELANDGSRRFFKSLADEACTWTTPIVVKGKRGLRDHSDVNRLVHGSFSCLVFVVFALFKFPRCNEEVLTGRRRKQDFKNVTRRGSQCRPWELFFFPPVWVNIVAFFTAVLQEAENGVRKLFRFCLGN